MSAFVCGCSLGTSYCVSHSQSSGHIHTLRRRWWCTWVISLSSLSLIGARNDATNFPPEYIYGRDLSGITTADWKWKLVGMIAVGVLWTLQSSTSHTERVNSFLFQVSTGVRQRSATGFVTLRTRLWSRPSSATGSESKAEITAIQHWSQFQTIPLELFTRLTAL